VARQIPTLSPFIDARRIESEGLHRTVCNYVAGMTDRYLLEEHGRLGALQAFSC
jgi:dGTPase